MALDPHLGLADNAFPDRGASRAKVTSKQADFERRLKVIEAIILRGSPIRGGVAANATVAFGKGFSVARSGGGSANGDYTVTFTQPFASTPAITLGLGPVVVTNRIIKKSAESASSFRVLISDAGVTANFDEPFSFIAMPT